MRDDGKTLMSRFDDSLPLDRASTIPAEWYCDPAINKRESDSVFCHAWQAVGRAEQVTQPGQFFTSHLGREPIVVIRSEDGVLRALSNVCRHRAARVVNECEGTSSRLRCRYHGWTYDLTGRLRGTPEFDGVADFQREKEALPARVVAEWGPFVWAQTGQHDATLEQWLSPLPRFTAPYSLESLRFVERREYVLKCNWKVYVDNYLDGGYHVNTLHPNLAGVLDYSQYRTEIFEYSSIQTSPTATKKGHDAADATRNVRQGQALYAWIFPNFMVNLYSGVMDTNLVIPEGPSRCRVIFDFFFNRDTCGQNRQFVADSIDVAEQVQKEDVEICEEVQQGLESGAFSVGRYSVKREAGVYHFHRLLARFLREFAE